MNESKRVALVLSSGGARGIAHIGVIKALQENGYQISSIAGSSIGAVVGAFYACGKLAAYEDWVCKLDRMDVFKLIDFSFTVQGFIKGEKVFRTLEEFIPDMNIENMNIPYCAVATDIIEKKEIVFESGSMYQAMKASIAIPTVIRPIKKIDMELIDGGVLNPAPVNHAKRQAGDILIVSNVSAHLPLKKIIIEPTEEKSYTNQLKDFRRSLSNLLPGSKSVNEKLGYFDLLNLSIDLMQDRITNLLMEKYKPDVHVKISRDAASTFEFYRAKNLIKLGYDACLESIGKLPKNY